MKTNLAKNIISMNVHSHNNRVAAFCEYYNLTEEEAKSAVELLDEYLGYGYTAEVLVLALRDKMDVSSQSIRLIKSGAYKNELVFQYLIEVAADNKANGVAAQSKIKQKLTT